MGKRKFKGRKMAAEQLSFYVDHIQRDVFTDSDTTLAPFLNKVLTRDVQLHVLSFLNDAPIRAAYYEDSLLRCERHYCTRQDDDFEVDILYKQKEIRENEKCKRWYVDQDGSYKLIYR